MAPGRINDADCPSQSDSPLSVSIMSVPSKSKTIARRRRRPRKGTAKAANKGGVDVYVENVVSELVVDMVDDTDVSRFSNV